jgi:hypothetical protein
MGRKSTKADKNIYQQARENCNLTREQASDLIPGFSPQYIVKIETQSSPPRPSDVARLAKAYKSPYLCNYYCSNECAIGLEQNEPEIHKEELSSIILKLLSTLNSIERKQDRLIDITADGKIDNQEIPDFLRIKQMLSDVSQEITALQLWTEQMLVDGKIDLTDYEYNQ